jgi:hypothetical protein
MSEAERNARVQLTTPNKQQQRGTWLMHKYALSFYLSPAGRSPQTPPPTRDLRFSNKSRVCLWSIENLISFPRVENRGRIYLERALGPIQSEHTHKTKLCLLGRWIREVLSGTVPAGRQAAAAKAGGSAVSLLAGNRDRLS